MKRTKIRKLNHFKVWVEMGDWWDTQTVRAKAAQRLRELADEVERSSYLIFRVNEWFF